MVADNVPCRIRVQHLINGLLLCLFIAGAVNAEASCKKGCPQSDNGFLKYKPGNVYEYNFDSILTVGLNAGVVSSETDSTNLKLLGTAKLFAEGNCGFTLQLSGIKVSATKEGLERKISQNIQKPIHFTWVSGKVEPQLCADGNDETYALNVKRAIVSLLQTSVQTSEIDSSSSSSEIDIFGQCPTHTSVSKVAGAEVVTKVRSLNSCAFREGIRSGIVRGIVNEAAGVRSTALLRADYSKESKIEQGIISNVHLVEDYRISAASKGSDTDVHAKVITQLKLKNASGAPAAPPSTGNNVISIIFQISDAARSKNLPALKTALTQAVETVSDYVQKDSARVFIELIRLLRNADADTLLELAAVPFPNKVLARKVYLDALFRTATSESAKAILKQLNQLNEKEKVLAILSLNLVQIVDRETLNQAAALLTANAPLELYLVTGTLVSKYIQRNGYELSEIEGIAKKFVDNLRHCKVNTKKDEERIVNVLKGIGNAHQLANAIVAAALTECAAPGRSNRVRVTALQAFASASCDATVQQKTLELLRDRNEDSELRIEAYLAAIQCPNAELANQIADILDSETVYQVGGFITSSLKVIRDSTDITRAQQRYHLSNIRLTKRFPKDYRRYSFNNELSYAFDALGIGASADYKLIYSQHGFLPRSGRLNVSTEVFGTNFNILELSVRQENLENVLEYYIGPKGLLNKDFDEIIKAVEIGGGADGNEGGRARRSIADDTAKFAKKYKTYGSKNVQDINLDLTMKLFGSELFFLSLGDNIPSTLDDIIRQFSAIFEKSKKELSSFDREFNVHNLFLDATFSYTTGLGVPLELSSQGFSATKLAVAAKIDIDAILNQNWQHAQYRIKVVPSVDVQIQIQLGFNALVLSSGIRVVSRLHSAGGGDFTFEIINDGNGFNTNIELPREKIELIDLKIITDFWLAEQDKALKTYNIKGSRKVKHNEPAELCFNQLEVVGLKVCVASSVQEASKSANSGNEINTNSKSHRLTDDLSFTLYLISERKLSLKGTHTAQTQNGNQQWKLDFSTPGSKESHDTSLAFELGTKSRIYARLAFDNAKYHLALEAGVNNDNKELVLYAQYEQDSEITKNKIGFTKNGNEYRPIIEIKDKNGISNEINGYRANGKVMVQKIDAQRTRYNFDNFEVTNEVNERIVLNGWTDVGQASLSTELRVTIVQSSYLLRSNFKLENGEYVVGLFVNDEKTPDNVIGGSAQVKIGEQEYNVQLISKAGSWNVISTNALEVHKSDNTDVSGKLNSELLVRNKNNIECSLRVSANVKSKTDYDVSVELSRGKKITSVAVKFNGNQRQPGDYNLEINGKLNEHTLDLLVKGTVNGNLLIVDNVVTTSWGTAVTVNGELGQRYTPQDIHVDLQGTAKFSGKDKPTLWTLKIIGAPEKTNGDFQLKRDNADLVKVAAETLHPQDKITAAKLNINVKNIIVGKADVKIAKNGKGELIANIETQKTEPKHKLDVNSKFHIQAPKYDIETTVSLDTVRKLYFKTENNLDRLKFNTKNIVEVAERKLALDANGAVKGDWLSNSEILANIALTQPSGHAFDGTIKRKITTNVKTGLAQGNFGLQLNEQLPNGGKKRTLAINGKIENWNVKANELGIEVQSVYTDFEGLKVEGNYHVKHLPKGQTKTIDIDVNLRGELVKIPLAIAFVVDEYDTKHANYHGSAKIGNYATANVNGNYNVGGSKDQLCTYELKANAQVPNSNFKSIDLQSSGKFLRSDATESGNYLLELHVDETSGDGNYLKLNTAVKGAHQQGSYKFDLATKELKAPFKLDGSYQREQQGNIREAGGLLSGKQKYSLNFDYAEKFVKIKSDISCNGPDAASIHYTLDSSFEAAKNIDVKVRIQKLDADSYGVTAHTKQNGQAYEVDTKLYRAAHKKGLDLQLTLPNGQPIIVVGIFELLGERKAKISLQIENLVDLDLQATSEAAYKAVDDFYIQAQWNSAKLKLNNYDLDVRSQGKAININLKNAQGLFFAGSVTYALKKEKNKAIIEGQGQIQYQGKTQQSNFKVIRQIYDIEADKEFGFSYTFNGNIGPKNGVSTLKITNKDFNVKLSICEEKKQCTNLQVQSIVNTDNNNKDDSEAVQHSQLILIDLRELGYPYEFELQSKTTNLGLKFHYNLDANIISNNNLKYQLIANLQPTNLKVQLNLPHREILFETLQQSPAQGQIFGHYEHAASFYIDKRNKPNDLIRLIASADISGTNRNAVNVQGVMKFEHPTIRALSISGRFDANREQQIIDAEAVYDVFRTPQQKITVTSRLQNAQTEHGFNITTTHELRSSGLGLQYDFNGHSALNTERQEFSAGAEIQAGNDAKGRIFVFGSKERVEALITGLNERILHLNGEINRQKYISKIDAKLQVLSRMPFEINTELHPTLAKFSIKLPGVLNSNVELKLGKEVKFNVEGPERPVISGRIALDAANFLQTSYTSNEADVQVFLDTVEAKIKLDADATREKIKERFLKLRQVIENQIQLSKESVPDFTQYKVTLTNNLDEIVKELEEDPALKQITETYLKLYTKLNKIANDVAKTTTEFYENLCKSLQALYEKLEVILKDSILPAWEEFLVVTSKIVSEIRILLINFHTKVFKTILGIIENYGPPLKNYGKALNDALKPFSEAAQELFKVSIRAAEELFNELTDYLAKLPTFDVLRNEFKNLLERLKLGQRAIEFVDSFFEELHILPQTPETSQFLEKAQQYLIAKLKQQPVNDEQLIEELLKLLAKALRSLWANIDLSATTGSIGFPLTNGLNAWYQALPYSIDFLSKIPALLSLRLSVFNFLLNENWESIFTRDHLKSWVFFHEFQLKGHVADGRHIFTFDGQYLTLPGTCKYILAQDSVDNNFTIVVQLNNGKLKTLTITGRDGGYLEVNDAGVLKLNGIPVEYPLHDAGSLHAWRHFYTVWLHSEYGVQVVCTSDLKVCHVDVNGFYTSKTRGLLGNGNAEPNDDWIQLDGTIAVDISSFVNGYGLGKCPAATAEHPVIDSENKRTELCNELFALDSTLAIGYLTLNAGPYRAACDAAVNAAPEKDKEAAACNIVTAYGSALKLLTAPVLLPSVCLKCAGTVGQRELGQEFTVKLPNNKADLVFVVDIGVTPDVLQQLVAPTVTEVRDTLKQRGFTDIQIAVIAFNESQRYPALLTSDNGKLNYQGNLAEIHLDGPKNFCDNCISQVVNDKKILDVYELVERLIKSVVPQSDELAWRLALNYPFRSGAAKSIIGVRSDSLNFGNLFKCLRAQLLEVVHSTDAGLIHLIAPVKDLALEGVPTEKLVGFNSRLVATLDGKDPKKRQKLQFENDLAIEHVLNNGGWVFATQNFESLKPQEKKKALNQVTNSIADSLFKTEIISDCKCVSVHGIHAQHKCTVRSSTFVPNKKVKAA